MGFLQIKSPPFMKPQPSTGPCQGTVDKLATFFLSKFQETKQDNEFTTLQCSTQLKFEALEKALQEQSLAMSRLRTEMQTDVQSEIQSFRDKAASYFLEKFSTQLDSVGARRSEKCELTLSRLEHRLDDEVKNLGDQLSDLSTKVAIGNAALSASIDDTGKKVCSGNDAAAENLQRCESEFRSKLSRLESLIDSSKTEATIERDRASRLFQEANKRLQSKVDSLERTVMRQSEELTMQYEKVDRFETELRNLSQLGIGQEQAQATVMKMISLQNDEIGRQSLHLESSGAHVKSSPADTIAASRQPDIADPTPIRPRAPPPSSSPTPIIEYVKPVQSTAAPPNLDKRDFKERAANINETQASVERATANQRKRPWSANLAKNDSLGPSPKRSRISKGKATQSMPKPSSLEVTVTPRSGVTAGTQPTMQKSVKEGSQKAQVVGGRNTVAPSIPDPGPESKGEMVAVGTRATLSLKRKERPPPDSTGRPSLGLESRRSPLTPRPLPPGGSALSRQKIQSRQDPKSKSPLQVRRIQAPTAPAGSGQVRGHGDSSPSASSTGGTSPLGKPVKDNDHRQTFASRREATMAFMKHVQASARDFLMSPPRSERQFIWSFLEGIPDAAWADFMERKLLETYPASVRPSLGIRAKYSINFDSGLTWRHVLEMMRGLQEKPGGSL